METKRAYRIIHPKSISELKKYVDEPKRYAVIYKTRDGTIFLLHPFGSGTNTTGELKLFKKRWSKSDLKRVVVIDWRGDGK